MDHLPSIAFQYNARRTAQASAWLLHQAHDDSLTHYVLLKLLFLTDRQRLLLHGEPLTGDRIQAIKFGPTPATTYDLINGKGKAAYREVWNGYVLRDDPSQNDLTPAIPAPQTWKSGYDLLSQSDASMLEGIWRQFGSWTFTELKNYTHSLPEWIARDPEANWIDPSQILVAGGWGDEAIESVSRHSELQREVFSLSGRQA